MRPHDHIGWIFEGEAGFERVACPFLAEGAARGERLMYISESPRRATAARLLNHYGPRVITVARSSQLYGESGVLDPVVQRARFATLLADALNAGFSGVRVAADNTPLVTDEPRLEAWVRWEHVADRFMEANPVTALCAFDAQRVDVNRLRRLSTLHPLSAAADPEPPFRVYSEAESLRLEGHVDSFALAQVPAALDALPAGTGVLIDLETATLMGSAPLTGLELLAKGGVAVTIRGAREALDAMAADGLRPDGPLRVEAAETVPGHEAGVAGVP